MGAKGLRWVLLGSLSLFAAFHGPADVSAQDFPSRHITLVVPYAAGGPTDINARLIAPALGEALGQSVVVENRGGAGTTLGTGAVAQAPADGYTLLFADLGLAVSHNLAKANYKPQKDFVPVGMVSRSVLALVVNPKVPANSLAELIALAKQKPGQMHYASAGLGSPPHLAGLALTGASNTDMVHVSYKGSGPAVGDVLSGQVEMMFLGTSASASFAKGGQLRALAVTGKERSTALPDVPTFREAGIDLGGIDSGTWWGIVAPAGTPPHVVAKLNKAVNKALGDPNVLKNFEKGNITAVGGTPDDFGAFLKSQWAYWDKVLADRAVKTKQ